MPGGPEVEASRRPGRRPHRDLRSLCVFIGPDRGGQGLVGSMLDAHPNAVVARSFSLFEDLGAHGRPRFTDSDELFDRLIRADRKMARRGRQSVRVRPDRANHRTSQAIAGQGYRGEAPLPVIGTDAASETARALSANPNALDDLSTLTGLDVRVIHVVRNPFDHIASMDLAAPGGQPVLELYEWIAETVAHADDRQILRVHLEDLIAQPGRELSRVSEFLGLDSSDEWVGSCAAIVEPLNESRHESEWPQSRIDEVDELIATFPWLERYRSDPAPASHSASPAKSTARPDRVRTFCAFVGHTRSGHSLAGALIDAHPNAIVAHHGKVFGADKGAGMLVLPDREKLFRFLVTRSIEHVRRGRTGLRRMRDGRRERYSYAVPGQWQGRYEELLVLGTQQAAEVSKALSVNPSALDELTALLEVPLKLISMVRNPWDHVESMGRGVPSERIEVRKRVLDGWLLRSRMVQVAKDRGYDVLDVALEELIAAPEAELRRICEFLDLEPLPDYLEACSSVVFDSPNRTQRDHDWTQGEIEAVTAAIDEFPWLERYRAVEAPTGSA